MAAADFAVLRLAATQHGVVHAAQCRELGLSDEAIAHRVRTGRWTRLHRSVFLAGPPIALTPHGRYAAANLAIGEDAAVSHRSAASGWAVQPHHSGPVHVTSLRKLGPRPGIVVHWTRRAPETVVRRGVRMTSLARTLVDLADVATPAELEEAIRAAERVHGFDRERLVPILGRKGTAGLLRGDRLVRGHLEPLFLRLLDEAGFVAPETNVEVLGYQLDALWREAGIAVEVDDYSTHLTRDAMDADRARDRRLAISGIRCARVTFMDLTDRRGAMLDDLRRLGVPRR